MSIGDLVRHKYGTLQGTGIILSIRPYIGREAIAMWAFQGQLIELELTTSCLEVMNE
jgi:hypothetical protein